MSKRKFLVCDLLVCDFAWHVIALSPLKGFLLTFERQNMSALAQMIESRPTVQKVAGSIPASDNEKSLYELSQTLLLSCAIKMGLVTKTCFLWLILRNLPLSSNTLNYSVIYNV